MGPAVGVPVGLSVGASVTLDGLSVDGASDVGATDVGAAVGAHLGNVVGAGVVGLLVSGTPLGANVVGLGADGAKVDTGPEVSQS